MDYKSYKEVDNKLSYEIDFSFITSIAERMSSNKHKYAPYNWKKLDNIEELSQALFRHTLEVMSENYSDEGRQYGHLEAIACNVMFILYQLKNNKNKRGRYSEESGIKTDIKE